MLFFILKPQNISIFSVVIASRARAHLQKKVRFLRQFQHQSGAKRKENYPFVRFARYIFFNYERKFCNRQWKSLLLLFFLRLLLPLHKYFWIDTNDHCFSPTTMSLLGRRTCVTLLKWKWPPHQFYDSILPAYASSFGFKTMPIISNPQFLNWTFCFFREALMMAQNDDIKEETNWVFFVSCGELCERKRNKVSMIIFWKNAMLIKKKLG